MDFDFDEPLVLEDSETEEQLHVLPDVLRDEYLRAIREHMDALSEGAARNRIDYELLRTSEPLARALFSYLSRRSQFG
jgi:3-deoxy-D-arabino-heptulosonate 7-phosphate (DAHP) synthase